MAEPRTTAGIDVGKDHLDLATVPAGPDRRFPNTPDGCAELATHLAGVQLVVVEATGGYEAAVVAALHLAGVPVAWYEILAYGICGLLAGVGGMILGSQNGAG